MSQYHKDTDTSKREPLRIKICGMKHNTAEVGTILHPDYLGFIFWGPSKRNFNGRPTALPHGIKKVGVFVDAYIEEIIEMVNTHQLLAVQLHGGETPGFCRMLKNSLMGVSIIKAFPIGKTFDFKVLGPFGPVCDYFLFDTKGELPGGNGYKFNWGILKNYPFEKPYFLSGGIGLENIGSIREFLEQPESKLCHAIDVNSKFEIEPGLKDIGKLEKFIRNLK
ncbi:MAG: N-(5'-phosphoribosyl)anthranilate isomerase [Maribacter sp.]|nr:MAG: N-(5'-phosphoribosyl)anthranilate isomerase [Maribacter sp.]